jgi:hypothetical protein
MRLRPDARLLFALLPLLLAPTTATAQTYDDAPLHTPIAFPDDSLPTTWPAFRATLETLAPQRLDVARLSALQQHLFALISADAKQRAARGEPVLPARDAKLAEMYEWGASLGVAGSELVAARLRGRGGDSTLMVELPGSFGLHFDSAYTLIAEDDGWLVRFPHYFMPGPMLRQPLENGAMTTVAVLSTLFANDSSGASQATIAIIAAQQDPEQMAGFWLNRFGIPSFAVVEPPVADAVRAYRSRHENAPLVNELVVFALPRGTILFVYSGALGTFEANHAHFVDLMQSLRVRSE